MPRLDGSADRAALAQLVGEALGRGALTARYELKLGAIPLSGTALAEALLHHALISLAENALLIG